MADVETPSLRERKKIQTRDTVRREAYRLFERDGYSQTTVEQIATAADVSPRTFFRYFPSKESLLVSDDCIGPLVDAFLTAPAELSPVGAFRHAVAEVFVPMSRAEFSVALARQRLIYALPEAKGALYDEYIRTVRMLSAAVAQRLDRPVDTTALAIAGAVTGVLMAAADQAPMSGDAIMAALAVLDDGLPH